MAIVGQRHGEWWRGNHDPSAETEHQGVCTAWLARHLAGHAVSS